MNATLDPALAGAGAPAPRAANTARLVYPHERRLGAITLALGLLALVLGTFGIVLIYLLLGFVAYLFVQSALIAYLRGTAAHLTAQQFPDLHAQYLECCARLGIAEPPEAYVLHGDGLFNAFATRFMGRDFVVLLSDVVDAMEGHPDGVRFYLGHELGHVHRRHLSGAKWRAPAAWLPLLGAAYARSRESTCDRYGRACCASAEGAARSLALLAAGGNAGAR